MTVYKTFFKIVKSHKSGIFTYVIIFMALTIVMSNFESKNAENRYEQTKVSMTVIDRDHSTLSKGLMDYLDETQKLVSLADDKEVWTDELYARNTNYILIIPENFEQDYLLGKTNLLLNYQLPDSVKGIYVDMQIDQFLGTLSTYLLADFSMEDALKNTVTNCNLTTSVTFDNTIDVANSYEKPAHYYYFQYIPYMFISIFLLGLAPVLLVFRNQKLKQRMDCSALSISKRNLQLIISSILFTIVCWIFFSICATVQYHAIAFTKEFLLLLLNSFIFALVSLAMTYFVVQFINNSYTLNPISNVIGLGSSFLCGVFVPQFLLGDSVLKIAQFLPPYWYIKGMDAAFSIHMSDYINCLLIQIGFVLVLLGIALVVSKQKLTNKHA